MSRVKIRKIYFIRKHFCETTSSRMHSPAGGVGTAEKEYPKQVASLLLTLRVQLNARAVQVSNVLEIN